MRPSSQIRADLPEQPEPPHPSAVRLARRAAELERDFGFVGLAELAAAGFTMAEIVEHAPAAQAILVARHG
jgi:hypothetical protein